MEKKRKNKASLDAATPKEEKKLDPKLEKLKGEFLEIAYYQAKRENLLLGEFSADGKYTLKNDILIQDLVSMPKVLQERVDNVVYAYAKVNGKNLNFKINLDISESYCSAEMFLIEIETKPDEDVKHLTSLGNYVEMYSPNFKDNVYKAWNINLQETPLDKDDPVGRMLKELEGEHNFSKELIEILSQLYVVRLLKLLENCGTLGLKIQGDYRALVEELIRKDPSLASDYTRLKQILDKMIAKHNGFNTILMMPGGADILKNFEEPIDRVRGKNAPVLVESGAVKEEKPKSTTEAKKPAGKKKKSKAKGGDSGKPFVYAIKNYKPQVLTTPTAAKKILPSIETAKAPVVENEGAVRDAGEVLKKPGGNKPVGAETRYESVAEAFADNGFGDDDIPIDLETLTPFINEEDEELVSGVEEISATDDAELKNGMDKKIEEGEEEEIPAEIPPIEREKGL